MNFFPLILTFCLTAIIATAADSITPPVFQMRLVLDEPTADSEQFELIGNIYVIKLEVQKKILIDQTALKSVTTSTNFGQPEIDFSLTPEGQKQFAEITSQNIGKRLAIIIDGKLISAPTILTRSTIGSFFLDDIRESVITEGKGEIRDRFSEQEAKDLAAKMEAAITK